MVLSRRVFPPSKVGWDIVHSPDDNPERLGYSNINITHNVRRQQMFPNRSITILASLLLLALLLISGCSSGAQPTAAAPPQAPSLQTVQPLIDKGNCGSCHTIPGVQGATGTVGPDWCVITKQYQQGAITVADIHGFIVNPDAKPVPGYPTNVMPKNFGTVFSSQELDTLATFIATLKCN
jgi:mono/diheme cytochrome c family protein